MSQLTAEEMQRRRKAREEEVYGRMTFVPDIDPLSRAIGRTRGLQELVENKGGCRARQAAKLAAEKLASSQCTFKPAIIGYPSSSNRSFERCVEKECEGETEEQRYNADLTPVGWAECPLMTHKKSLSSSSSSICRGERGGDEVGDVADVTSSGEDSLDPLRSRCAEESKGPRSKHSHGTHGRSSRCMVNLNEPERMSRSIRERQEAKEKRRRDELIARDIEEMKECTFQPALTPHTNTSRSRHNNSHSHSHSDLHALYSMSPQDYHHQQQQHQPVIVRGLGRHLELKHLSLRQREEASRREIAVFSVTNIDNFRRQEDGSTIIKVT